MEFRHPDGRHVSVILPRRSLLVMTGESRYLWSHGSVPGPPYLLLEVKVHFTAIFEKIVLVDLLKRVSLGTIKYGVLLFL